MTMSTETIILSARIHIDSAQHGVWRDGHLIYLPARTWTILDSLLHHSGQLVTSEVLLAIAWPDEPGHARADLYRHIRRIRQAIEPDPRHPQLPVPRRDLGYELLWSTDGHSR